MKTILTIALCFIIILLGYIYHLKISENILIYNSKVELTDKATDLANKYGDSCFMYDISNPEEHRYSDSLTKYQNISHFIKSQTK